VVFLGLGLPVLFGLSLPLVQSEDTVQVRIANPAGDACLVQTAQRQQQHTERSWWLLGANPFVVVADSAPAAERRPGVPLDDPLTAIRNGVRELRLGPPAVVEECYLNQASYDAEQAQRQSERNALAATWPYGLAADLALGAGFTAIAVVRLRAPSRRLPRGTRVA
jgi:hypothetical protein